LRRAHEAYFSSDGMQCSRCILSLPPHLHLCISTPPPLSIMPTARPTTAHRLPSTGRLHPLRCSPSYFPFCLLAPIAPIPSSTCTPFSAPPPLFLPLCTITSSFPCPSPPRHLHTYHRHLCSTRLLPSQQTQPTQTPSPHHHLITTSTALGAFPSLVCIPERGRDLAR